MQHFLHRVMFNSDYWFLSLNFTSVAENDSVDFDVDY